jgi:hypothetical protein
MNTRCSRVFGCPTLRAVYLLGFAEAMVVNAAEAEGFEAGEKCRAIEETRAAAEMGSREEAEEEEEEEEEWDEVGFLGIWPSVGGETTAGLIAHRAPSIVGRWAVEKLRRLRDSCAVMRERFMLCNQLFAAMELRSRAAGDVGLEAVSLVLVLRELTDCVSAVLDPGVRRMSLLVHLQSVVGREQVWVRQFDSKGGRYAVE